MKTINDLLDHKIENFSTYMSIKNKDFKAVEPVNPISQNENVILVSHSLNEISHIAQTLQEIFTFKENSIYKSMKYALLNDNFLFLAESARAFFELISTKIYLAYVSDHTSDFLCQSTHEKEIIKSIESLKNHYETILYSTGEFQTSKYSERNRKNKLQISNTVKYFKKYITDKSLYETLIEIYKVLSEYTHPNLGSNIVVSNGKLISNAFVYSTHETVQQTGHKIKDSIGFLFEIEFLISNTFLKSITVLDDLLHISQNYDLKLTKLFIPINEYMGTGETKEQAYHFHKARTHREALYLSIILAEKLRLQDRTIGAIENGYVYDLYVGPKGKKVWMKVPSIDKNFEKGDC